MTTSGNHKVSVKSVDFHLFTFSDNLENLEEICNNVLSVTVNPNFKVEVPKQSEGNSGKKRLNLKIETKKNTENANNKDKDPDDATKLLIKLEKSQTDVNFFQIKQDYNYKSNSESKPDYELALKYSYNFQDISINLDKKEEIKSINPLYGKETKYFFDHLFEDKKSNSPEHKESSKSINPLHGKGIKYFFEGIKIFFDHLFEDKKSNSLEDTGKKSDFLGQTIIITIKIQSDNLNHTNEHREKLKKVADTFIDSLFESCEEERPRFNRSGDLLGNPILEYGIFSDLYNYSHILVWFLLEGKENNKIATKNNKIATSEHIFKETYTRLVGLFLFRARVIDYFKQSRRELEDLKKHENEIMDIMDELSEPKRIQELQSYIFEILEAEKKFEKAINKIEKAHADIIKYIRRYEERMQQIIGIYLEHNLGFLKVFNGRTCQYFLEQIEADLMYIKDDSKLAEKALNSIKTLVEIKQTQEDNVLNSIVIGTTFSVVISGALAGTAVLVAEQKKMEQENQPKIPGAPNRSDILKKTEGQKLPDPLTVMLDWQHPYVQYAGIITIVSLLVGFFVSGLWLYFSNNMKIGSKKPDESKKNNK